MEEFKAFDEITQPDARHALLGQITGCPWTLEALYDEISEIELHDDVPEDLRSQFNVIRNLAIYTWYSYSLDPIVELKCHILIEYALKLKEGSEEYKPFPRRLKKALKEGWIQDCGFRQFKSKPKGSQDICKELFEYLPLIRNMHAHGSNYLDQTAIRELQFCADFINQLF